jgi:hypothetical protein
LGVIEGILNRLAVTGMDCVRWAGSGNNPDSYDLNIAPIAPQKYSLPVPIHGMELTTFQAVFIPDPIVFSDVSCTLHFQTSQDGSEWDDVPDWEFSIDPSTIVLSRDLISSTYEVMANEAYIRVVASFVTEGGPAPLDHVRIYVTTKET